MEVDDVGAVVVARGGAELLGEASVDEGVGRDAERLAVKSTSADAVISLHIVPEVGVVSLDLRCQAGVSLLAAPSHLFLQRAPLPSGGHREGTAVLVQVLTFNLPCIS